MPDKPPEKPIVNLADVALREQGHGDAFAVRWGRMGPALGLSALGCALHVVPPGKRAFPFHAHHVAEELFYIVSGEGEYRYGDQRFAVKPGDVIGAPAGKIAHQLINTGSGELRYLGVSSSLGTDVVEYPDSGKFAVAAGIKDGNFRSASFMHIGRAGAPLDYWDGEDG